MTTHKFIRYVSVHNPLVACLANDLVDRLGEVVDVVLVETSHADAAVLGHVDVRLLAQLLDLLLRETSEAEHTDLVSKVVPGAGSAKLLELASQSLAHLHDAAGHSSEVLLPLGEELRGVQDSAGNASTVQGRVGDFGSLEGSELGVDADGAGGGIVGGGKDGVEGTSTLTIETEVLGETLSNEELEALLDEVVDGPGIAGEVARGKALVGAVEEGEVVLLAHNLGDLLPLLLGRVNTSGVVGAGVEDEDGALRGVLESRLHALPVKALGLLVEVGVCGNIETDVLEDLVVVDPGRVRHVDSPAASEELGQEEGAQMDSTGS